MISSKEDEQPPTKRSKAKVIRPLGYLERLEAAMHSLSFYYSSMVTCRYAIPAALSTGLDQDPALQAKLERKVQSAVARIVLDHPFLRVGLRGEHARKPAFVELEAVDFRRHIAWRRFNATADYEAELLALIQSQLDIKVPQVEDAPSWRILVLRVEGEPVMDVMFEWGHAHLDGMSAKMFHENLLLHLNSDSALEVPLKDHVLVIPPSRHRDLQPSLHALTKFPVTPGYALSTLWVELKPPGIAAVSKSDLHATWAPILLKPYVTQYRHFGIDNRTLQNVLAACRKHNTTLTGLIQAMTHVSLATRLSVAEARGFLGCTIVNLRPLMCAPEAKTKIFKASGINPKDIMGNFMTMIDHEFDATWVTQIRAASISQDERLGKDEKESTRKEEDKAERRITALEPLVWKAAEIARAVIQKRLDDGTKNDLMGLMKFIPDFRILLKDWMKKPRPHSVAVTNLGVIDGTPHDKTSGDIDTDIKVGEKWALERAIFSVSPEAHGAALTICPIAVKGKELYVSCNWQDCAVDSAIGEGVMADLESWLRFLGEET
ncbi:hypothetical protein F4781DRAFT_356888 [Annulohypoxylon bovei var. microspora]|nr:hypothetical protein F4781DRAFT_356888 [Annulohypoxylon bovei var. microspora]